MNRIPAVKYGLEAQPTKNSTNEDNSYENLGHAPTTKQKAFYREFFQHDRDKNERESGELGHYPD